MTYLLAARRTPIGKLLGALTTVPAPPAISAGPPSALQSEFADPLCVSPKNLCVPTACRCRFEGILRDAQGVPIPNFPASQVVLDFTACANPSTRPQDRIPADRDSDANGLVFWEEGLHFGEQRLVAGTRLVEKGRAIGWIAADGCLVDSGHLLPALGSEVHAGLPGRRFRLKARRGDGPCLLLVKRLRVAPE